MFTSGVLKLRNYVFFLHTRPLYTLSMNSQVKQKLVLSMCTLVFYGDIIYSLRGKRQKKRSKYYTIVWWCSPLRRLEYNIEMNLQEMGWEVVDWIDLAVDRQKWRGLMNTVMTFRVP